MLRLVSVHLENFLSHADSTMPLANLGLVLIRGVNEDAGGSNAAGKSAILSSITFCLFGQTYQGLKSDEVIRTGQSGCRVEVTGEKDGVPFVVARSRGPANLFFSSGDNDLSGASIKDTQDRIEQFLGLDYKTFIATVLFPQSAQGLASLPQAEQREILGKILDLDRFEVAFERARSFRDALKEDLVGKDSELLSVNASIELERKHLVQIEASKRQFEVEQAEKVKKLRDQLYTMPKPEPPDGLLLTELKELEAADPLLAHQRLVAGNALQERKHNEALAEIAVNRRYHETLLKALKGPQDRSDKTCGACGQSLPPEALQEAAARHKHALAAYHRTFSAYEDEITRLASKETQLVAQKAVAAKAYAQQLQESERQVRVLHELRHMAASSREHAAKVKVVEDKITVEEQRNWSGESMMRSTKETIGLLEQRVPKLSQDVSDLKSNITYVDFWYEGFGAAGLRHYYLASITPYLSDRANHYISELTAGAGSISVTTQKETKKGGLKDELTIVADLGSGPNFAAKSGGEAQRINIALLFALAELMSTRARVSCSTLFLDEILDGLDQPGVEQVVKLLNTELIGRKESIFVISHNADLASEFENVITVVKKDGVSKIV